MQIRRENLCIRFLHPAILPSFLFPAFFREHTGIPRPTERTCLASNDGSVPTLGSEFRSLAEGEAQLLMIDW
jgi:hypothetical protein